MLQRLSHLSIVEQQVLLWKNDTVFKPSLDKIFYTAPGTTNTAHPGTCTEINNNPKFANSEKPLPFITQQNISCTVNFPTGVKIKTTVDVFNQDVSKTRRFIWDACAVTYFVEIACMLNCYALAQNIFGCEKDDYC